MSELRLDHHEKSGGTGWLFRPSMGLLGSERHDPACGIRAQNLRSRARALNLETTELAGN